MASLILLSALFLAYFPFLAIATVYPISKGQTQEVQLRTSCNTVDFSQLTVLPYDHWNGYDVLGLTLNWGTLQSTTFCSQSPCPAFDSAPPQSSAAGVFLSIACNNLLLDCSVTVTTTTAFCQISSTQAPTTQSPTIAAPTSTAPTTAAPTPPAGGETPVQWAGQYDTSGSACQTSSCCCMTGIITVTQSGLAVTISGGSTCGAVDVSGTISSTTSNVVNVYIGGTSYTVQKTDTGVIVTNNDSPVCSGSASLVAAGPGNSLSSTTVIIIIAVCAGGVVLIIVSVVTVVLVRRKNARAQLHVTSKEMLMT